MLHNRIFNNRVANDVLWVAGSFGVVQIIRLATNIILAWLLTPAIFGVLALITALRTGVELLTDVGVAQNIVASSKGDEPAFVRTGWTIQVIRGGVLTIIGLATAWPLAHWYGQPELLPMLAASASIFVIAGITPPSKAIMQRRRETKRLTLFDLFLATWSAAFAIGFALVMPSVWGMIWSNIAYAVFAMIAGFFVMDSRILGLAIAPEYARAFITFGKWIFASSIIYFVATHFDRLYLPMHIPFALFGIYSVAKTMADAVTLLVQRMGAIIVFPAIARAGSEVVARRHQIGRMRLTGLAIVTVAIFAGVAVADIFVRLAYDDRYAVAEVILPLLLIGTWFSAQSAIGESVLLGLSAPAKAAAGNAAKLAWTVVLLPTALMHSGYLLAFAGIALADLPRYLIVQYSQWRAGLRFLGQDFALILLGIAAFLAARGLLIAVGLADGLISTGQWSALFLIG